MALKPIPYNIQSVTKVFGRLISGSVIFIASYFTGMFSKVSTK